jgi:hypothetical protein
MNRPLRSTLAVALALVLLAGTLAAVRPAESQTPKSGGSLNVMLREDLSQGFDVPCQTTKYS